MVLVTENTETIFTHITSGSADLVSKFRLVPKTGCILNMALNFNQNYMHFAVQKYISSGKQKLTKIIIFAGS